MLQPAGRRWHITFQFKEVSALRRWAAATHCTRCASSLGSVPAKRRTRVGATSTRAARPLKRRTLETAQQPDAPGKGDKDTRDVHIRIHPVLKACSSSGGPKWARYMNAGSVPSDLISPREDGQQRLVISHLQAVQGTPDDSRPLYPAPVRVTVDVPEPRAECRRA
jgi:hypothetical protein